MKKILLLTHLIALFTVSGFSQTGRFWSSSNKGTRDITPDKAVSRLSFPKTFKLFELDLPSMRQELFTVVNNVSRHSTTISLPNADGSFEQFEVVEASNFDPALQAQFPEIRAFSGKGITDKYATLKLSISPQGIQTMIFRTGKENEFIEPYSQDHIVYAVFKSYRTPGQLPWSCSTRDAMLATDLNNKVTEANATGSSSGQLKTMRLAQSVNAEYSNYFGATSAAQAGLVLAAVNNTITRCNGVFEKDLAVHLNLIANTTAVFYYNPSTDPYTAYNSGNGISDWNSQLQSALTSVIGEANYDIGHLFGRNGGGGNAGCIGCVCTNGSKGSGITSPADGIPQGDNFDIDYVVHEMGHQLGANHTFSFTNENSGVNKEIGSGITIMGYAGITPQDVAPHSIDIFHEASIAQIQANLANKTCPVTTNISANNATPVVAAVASHTIPKSTPFALTGSATDANSGDVLTYCWEENDNASSSQTGASSVASATKASGPNWLSFLPTVSPIRYCPELSTILAGLLITPVITGGDAGTNIEALSSVARTLNFRLTVRDNAAYSSTAPVKVGQTSFTDMTVTVDAGSGPFAVSVPNTAVSWAGGSTQTITWAVANSTASPVSCANVKISLSTDGGQTFPTVLTASTPNDGTEALVIPNTPSTTARIKVEAVGNIFFDISNTNFTITAGSGFTTITTQAISPATYCAGAAVSVPYTTNGNANAGNVFTAQLSNASGSFASPVAIGTLTATASGTISATIPSGTAAGTGYRIRVVSSSPAVTGSDNGANLAVIIAPTASTITAGGPTTFCTGGSVVLSGNTNGGAWYQNGTAVATGSTYTATAAGDYTVVNTNNCGSATSNHIIVTVNTLPAASTITAGGPTTFCTGGSVVLSGNTNGGAWYQNGTAVATGSTYTATSAGDYSVVNTNSCGSATSNHITVTVNTFPATSTITAGGPITFCTGGSVVLSGNTNGGAWYQNSTAVATGTSYIATTAGDYTVRNTNNCGTTISNHITVTVNPLPTVSYNGLAASYPVNAAAVSLTGSPTGGTFSGPGISGNSFTASAAGIGGPYTIIYTYTNANGCTNTASHQTTVTGACTVPVQPGTITTAGGTAKVCPGDVKTYSIAAVTGATNYTWTAPAGAVVTGGQGTTSATVTYNQGFTAGDSLKVTATNSCGSSVARALKINRNSPASTPGAIMGSAYGVCNSSAVPYSVAVVSGVTYAWSWNTTAASIASGQGTNAITAGFGNSFVSGKLSVTATNTCGASSARSLTVYARPVVPAAVSGSTSVCQDQQGVPFSIAPVSGASSYIWYAPSGSHISDGGTTSSSSSLETTATSVTINFGSTAGQVRVKGVNSCAAGGVASTTVTFSCRENKNLPAGEIISSRDMLIYPNPSDGNFRITLNSDLKNTNATISIMNEFGQVVYQTYQTGIHGSVNLTVSDKLTNGIYLVSCTVNGVKTVKKLVISK